MPIKHNARTMKPMIMYFFSSGLFLDFQTKSPPTKPANRTNVPSIASSKFEPVITGENTPLSNKKKTKR